MPPRPRNFSVRNRGYLPHWETKEGRYSVTFRLVDSLPQDVINLYRRERDALLRLPSETGRDLSAEERARLHELFSEKIEEHLDAGIGECWLARPAVAEMVQGALHFFHRKRYTLFAWCVMPNHVHVLFQAIEGFELDGILHSWKSFTGNEANRLLSCQGQFWMPEYYDHLIRDDTDFHHYLHYIVQNPVKAGLINWPYVGRTTGGQDARVT